MSNTYTWTISEMDCRPQVGDLTDYVVTSHWICSGTDGTFTGSFYSTASFTVDPEKPNYTPYDELTEAEVIAWTQAALGVTQVTAIYTSIDSQIQNQIDPPIVTLPLPWNTPPV